jgi:Concanavalin A-like lectin/glucanases superfamily
MRSLRSKQRGFLLSPPRFPSDLPYDPFFSHTLHLLHFDDTSFPLTNNGTYGAPFSAYESVTTSTTKKLFGTRSLRLPGSSFAYINVGTPFFIGNQPFTIELAFNSDVALNSGTNVARLAGIFQAGYYSWVLDYTGTYGLRFYVATASNNAAAAAVVSSSITFAADTWNRIAVCGDATTIYLFANGVLLATTARANLPETGNILAVGGSNAAGDAAESFVGYIDEFRYTVGTCRHTSSYAVRGSAFPNS